MQFSFAGHTLDVDRRELRRGSELIPVEPQVFDVLVYLIRNRGRVVSRDDLLAAGLGRTDRIGVDADEPHQRGKEGGRR